MDDILAQITGFIKGAWKHRWIGLLVAWIVGVVGAAVVLRMPDQYEASARIYVDTQSILKPLMSGLAVQPNVNQQIVMLSRTLVSRPNVEKVIRMADLDLANKSPADREATIDRVMKGMTIRGAGRDNMYTISFRDAVPQQAQKVVQSLVSIFVESSLGDSRKDAEVARRFIDDQIKSYETRLEAAETRLKEFKLRNIEMQSASGPDMAGRIGELSAQYSRAKLELLEAEKARDAAKTQLAASRGGAAGAVGGFMLPDTSPVLATPEFDARISEQQRSLDMLLQRYTEQHPDVAGTRRLIANLEEQKRKKIEELRKAVPASSSEAVPAGNLAAQELSRLLAAAEIQVASLGARVAEYGERYNKALDMVKTAPQVEAEFAQLNRDYAINKKNYEDLVGRRESASLSGNLESVAGVADFRLIDPPRVAPQPVAPNRSLLLLVAMGAAMGAGVLVALGMGQLRPVFHDARVLRSVVGLPLLGVVTLVPNEAAKKKDRADLLRFGFASSGLIACFAIGIAFLVATAAHR
ncbi:XrtA system polysaccharide chain length determinant [Pseudorhodoferax sp.]|uniref:XrtA system polysaccharide chain length determinant n=1 Tax=Pseudorhodoferax sp. TaxID=1993553 RepID=UPI002DD6A997|nr:XrtA system polysaccharide chain length determinant [Pseudorhodoferax sp.]